MLPHRDSKDVFILGGTDDIQVLLDDSQVHMYIHGDKDLFSHTTSFSGISNTHCT